MNFNPRSPRGLRLSKPNLNHWRDDFNPRSPRGLRPAGSFDKMLPIEFQSTQPKRAATRMRWFFASVRSISIHAAQEGCDLDTSFCSTYCIRISIHAAQEGCDLLVYHNHKEHRQKISIHAAQEGCDWLSRHKVLADYEFQSTQPKRAATV